MTAFEWLLIGAVLAALYLCRLTQQAARELVAHHREQTKSLQSMLDLVTSAQDKLLASNARSEDLHVKLMNTIAEEVISTEKLTRIGVAGLGGALESFLAPQTAGTEEEDDIPIPYACQRCKREETPPAGQDEPVGWWVSADLELCPTCAEGQHTFLAGEAVPAREGLWVPS